MLYAMTNIHFSIHICFNKHNQSLILPELQGSKTPNCRNSLSFFAIMISDWSGNMGPTIGSYSWRQENYLPHYVIDKFVNKDDTFHISLFIAWEKFSLSKNSSSKKCLRVCFFTGYNYRICPSHFSPIILVILPQRRFPFMEYYKQNFKEYYFPFLDHSISTVSILLHKQTVSLVAKLPKTKSHKLSWEVSKTISLKQSYTILVTKSVTMIHIYYLLAIISVFPRKKSYSHHFHQANSSFFKPEIDHLTIHSMIDAIADFPSRNVSRKAPMKSLAMTLMDDWKFSTLILHLT